MPTLYFNRIYIMTRPELIDYLFQLILQRLEPEFAPEEAVEHTESTTLEELGFDSIDKIDIVLVVETHFKVKVSREQLRTIKTVGDIADVLLTIKPSICDKKKNSRHHGHGCLFVYRYRLEQGSSEPRERSERSLPFRFA